jgi:hypothetical protein
MITSYWVHCPHSGCNWSGNLLPRDDHHVWDAALPSKKVVTFHCPRCDTDIPARVKGDDVIPLLLEESSLS